VTKSEGDEVNEQIISSELERLAEALQVTQNGQNGSPPESSDSTMASILLSEKYRGAFIHPDLLEQFGRCIKDGAERAFSLTEREQEHRHRLDDKFAHAQTSLVEAQVEKLTSENKDRRLLIILAFIYFVFIGAGGFAAIMTNHAVGGASVLGGGGLVAISGILLAFLRRGQPSKEK
jgi:uncharacterized membrane protein